MTKPDDVKADTVRFYCECCDESRPVVIDELMADKLNGNKIWGDICCAVCHLVIATIEADSPGRYAIVRVDDE